MRTVERNIAGAFIFSKDKKVLLGYNRKGGAYQGMLVIPGGGIEDGETEIEAVQREILEETGINIANAEVTQMQGIVIGESEKTLKSGETVWMKMSFHDFEVHLPEFAKQVALKFDDDYVDGDWFTAEDLINASIGKATEARLKELNFL